MEHLQEVADLKAAFLTDVDRDTRDRQLRDAVCSLTRTLRTAGWPVEAVIILVKKTASDAGTTYDPLTATLKDARDEQPVERAVRWCIEHYYA